MNKKDWRADGTGGWEKGDQGLLASLGASCSSNSRSLAGGGAVTHLCPHPHQLGEAAGRGEAGIHLYIVALQSYLGPTGTQ